MRTDIQYQLIETFQGIDIYLVATPAGPRFVAWMDKFYSADAIMPIHALIVHWWRLRRN